jgi:predicted ATPase/class 3 adenylate cyclase
MTLPTGPAVTFLFTDIEGSTRSERALGSAAWAALVARHDELLAAAIEGHGGAVVKTEGDAFFAAFGDPLSAVTAAVAAQRAVASEAWDGDMAVRVRMGLHLGEGRLRAARNPGDTEDYVGIDVNYAARIAAAGNGGQIVLSRALVDALPANLTTIAGLGDVVLVHGGLRAVKDFDEPLALYRLAVLGAADDDRPLRTTDAPTNLPGEVTSLVGRDDERAAVRAELEASRIVTLTGPGGSGKTRLALAVARDVRDAFPHGTWFVDLAAIRDPARIEPTIAAALGVRESTEQRVEDALREHLRERTCLLILDNLEQLLPDGAQVVARLTRDASALRLLVTSRELLRISGERGHPVPPLEAEAGVALFLDRAGEHRPGLVLDEQAMTAIRAIAERLGGLPLALELAAARTRMLSPSQIRDRLEHSLDLSGGARDLPERQQTLRAAIAWSDELLAAPERRLFARLSVFAGGWTASTAEPVANAAGDLGLDVVDGLESLTDKSLIRIEPAPSGAAEEDAETRFSLHPLLREYAHERLGALGELRETEGAFVAECVGIAMTAGDAILGETGEATMRWLDREERNLRAAVDWTLAHDDPDDGLRIIGATWRWYQQRGRLREARGLLTRLLSASSGGDPRVRISGLAAEGSLAYWMDDFAAASAAYRERLELAMASGDSVLMADAHYDIGFLSMVAHEGDLLRDHEQQALDLYLAAGREDGAIRARQGLVLAVFLAGDYGKALDLETQNFDAFSRKGSHFEVADSLTLLSAISWRLGETQLAWQRASEGLRYFWGTDSASGLVRNLGMAAIIQLSDGDPELGARIAGATYRLLREKGVMLAPVKVLHLPDPVELANDRFGAERAAVLLAEGEVIPVEDVVATVFATPAPSPAVVRQAPEGTRAS